MLSTHRHKVTHSCAGAVCVYRQDLGERDDYGFLHAAYRCCCCQLHKLSNLDCRRAHVITEQPGADTIQ